MTLQFATEALKADREIVLAAVRVDGYALQYATEALRGDREVVLAAVQQKERALEWTADDLLEDPTFATDAKRRFRLLKLTMLSGRSTVVVAGDDWNIMYVLTRCRERLGLASDVPRTTMALWHGSDWVPVDGTEFQFWPGIQPHGQISEYQLLLKQ
eukprot:5558634-Amphidinium_carterae.1